MMKPMVRNAVALGCLLLPTGLVGTWVSSAQARLQQAEAAGVDDAAPQVAVASAANESYCTGDLKKVLRRVLKSCGLLESGELRGCKPVDAKNVATMAGGDFNALFLPLAKRAGIIEFDKDSAEMDVADTQLLDQVFADQQGASYFFVVSRASPDGSVEHNRELSQGRAEIVMSHLRQTFSDPDLDREVGLLWLGEEFAQLDEGFCSWKRSGTKDTCEPENINRSAFVAWIDCRL